MDRQQNEFYGTLNMTKGRPTTPPPALAQSTDVRVAVIGAGWAGLAAALELTSQGIHVTLLERARRLGGRARALTDDQCDTMQAGLDNGQHILLGAYRTSLDLMQRVGVSTESALLRLPLQLRYADGFALIAAAGGKPQHLFSGLLRAQGLTWSERIQLAQKLALAALDGWRCKPELTVAQWLTATSQRTVERIWQPLCVSALNTPIEEASAQIFLNVLRDALLSGPGSSDLLIPRTDFGSLFANPAESWLKNHGAAVVVGQPAQSLVRSGRRWVVKTPSTTHEVDGVIIAAAPRAALRLLRSVTDDDALPLAAVCTQLEALDYAPITTVYLPVADLQLPAAMLALRCHPEQGKYGQFLFDRGSLQPGFRQKHWAVVISVADAAMQLSREALAAAICQQVIEECQSLFPSEDLSKQLLPEQALVITEKQATFRSRPRLDQPKHDTGVTGLVLAGDYIAGPYPATLESAARSGVSAAHALVRQLVLPASTGT